MSALIFDGKAYASGLLKRVTDEVAVRVKPIKLATVFDSRNEAARMYTKVKAKAAGSVGIMFEAHDLSDYKRASEVIKTLNKDPETLGIMVQLPFVGGRLDSKLCHEIAKEKDVDGLNPISGVQPATVRAVTAIVSEGLDKVGKYGNWPLVMAVVGSRGNVGRGVIETYDTDVRFRIVGMDKGELRSDRLREADVVVSAVGAPGLISPEMIKPGAVVVDVGYPHGDVLPAVVDVAGFLTPVPGGVGPVTVAMLFRNLLEL